MLGGGAGSAVTDSGASRYEKSFLGGRTCARGLFVGVGLSRYERSLGIMLSPYAVLGCGVFRCDVLYFLGCELAAQLVLHCADMGLRLLR